MSGIAPLIIWIILIFICIFVKGLQTQKKDNESAKRAAFTPPKPAARRITPNTIRHIAPENNAPSSAKRYGAVSLKDSSSNMFLEDRNNDWLAKQIKEERKILMQSDILDLGAAHEKACQAEQLKRFHILEHDDSIDTAEER